MIFCRSALWLFLRRIPVINRSGSDYVVREMFVVVGVSFLGWLPWKDASPLSLLMEA